MVGIGEIICGKRWGQVHGGGEGTLGDQKYWGDKEVYTLYKCNAHTHTNIYIYRYIWVQFVLSCFVLLFFIL